MTNYPRTLRAANAVSKNKKALAEALAAEIPPQPRGGNHANRVELTVEQHLAAVRIDLLAAGHVYSLDTLTAYREVGLWVGGKQTPDVGGLPWLSISWSVHREAYEGGITFARLRQLTERQTDPVTTVDSLRRALNKTPTRRTSSEKLDTLTEDEKARIAQELLDDPDKAREVLGGSTPAARQRRQNAAAASSSTELGSVWKAKRTEEFLEDAENPEEIEDLTTAMDAVDGAIDELADAVYGGPSGKHLRDAQYRLHLAVKEFDINTHDIEMVTDRIEKCERHLAILRSLAQGHEFSDEDAEFMKSIGVTL